ncbi:MAG: ATP phosphoribosyltransferase regulatory subunit [Gammaproteobacteria bacterium]|nr:ATP phosphoribosyltransferase regulatory subunit [Gammaproteobacteria bacterium]
MKRSDQWLLPEGIEEVLPDRAARLERLRRRLLDVLDRRGFNLVRPPLVEYLDALLTGVGEDLDVQTVKLTDSVSGRLMGVRADHTPQIARIDAHYLRHEGMSRLCYSGSVFRWSPGEIESTREPLQIGAELYGCPDVDADAEIVEAMIDTVQAAGVPDVHVHLGHVGVYRALIQWAGLSEALEADLFDALRRQSRPDVEAILSALPEQKAAFRKLLESRGDAGVIDAARHGFEEVPGVAAALSNLTELLERLERTLSHTRISVDLSDLRGYRYHTGTVFNVYTPGYGRALAQGGRYDEIGRAFGRARSATGFSADLRRLLRYDSSCISGTAILAPSDGDGELDAMVRRLRADGERVIRALPGESVDQLADQCDRELIKRGDGWHIQPLEGQAKEFRRS